MKVTCLSVNVNGLISAKSQCFETSSKISSSTIWTQLGSEVEQERETSNTCRGISGQLSFDKPAWRSPCWALLTLSRTETSSSTVLSIRETSFRQYLSLIEIALSCSFNSSILTLFLAISAMFCCNCAFIAHILASSSLLNGIVPIRCGSRNSGCPVLVCWEILEAGLCLRCFFCRFPPPPSTPPQSLLPLLSPLMVRYACDSRRRCSWI